jgi:hypothetical protein
VSTMLGARSIKPLEGSRPWLRRTRALCKFNGGEMKCWDAPRLCGGARQTTTRDEKARKAQNRHEEKA